MSGNGNSDGKASPDVMITADERASKETLYAKDKELSNKLMWPEMYSDEEEDEEEGE